ncbi:MAG: glycoside hydrolase family 3 C-terminal domain-containing protein, partial [Dehalococcoidales bacterium]|nr:glycoside hydrolase family 3 C-terminal domain-containing protein [Dehalococcoidales bacterium]
RMTLEEKVSLLAGIDFWHTGSVERLGIPSIKMTDGPHGARTMSDKDPNLTLPATAFPVGVAMAATWNTRLIERVGAAIGREARARGCAVLLAPCVNIHRIPLGGRNFESFSEDPYLSARMTVAYIRGVQSQKVAATVKHFALNNSEFERLTISSDAAERTIREIYFPSFEAAVKEAHSWALMCSYNRVNGVHASENRWLLREVLKVEWGFDGVVVSDWFATHSTVPAANAGLDVEMPGPPRYFGKALVDAVRRGEVAEAEIDDKVRRLLRLMARTGALDKKFGQPARIPRFRSHRRLAREIAAEAIVLLKNEGDILPLNRRKLRKIAVIGANAIFARTGGGGSSQVCPYQKVPPLEVLRRRLRGKVEVGYELGFPNNIATLPLDPSYLWTDTGKRTRGLTGEYFAGSDFSGDPLMVRVDRSFEFRWIAGTGPCREIRGGDFSIRWQGFFDPPADGRYRFGLATNGWVRIMVDGKVVASNWGNPPLAIELFIPPEVPGEVDLERGRLYPITVEFTKNPLDRLPARSIRLGCNLPLPDDLIGRAVRLAASADAVIIFAGLSEEYESEGFDRRSMELPAEQVEAIRRVTAENRKTIVVLNNGAPLGMEDWADAVPAILEAWYPGEEGARAIVDVIFGDVNPSGRLPDTFPRHLADSPAFPNYPGNAGSVRYGEGIFVGYRHYDARGIEVRFPFGHGLSYTSFQYRNLRVTPPAGRKGQEVRVEVDITNTGRRKGSEVVQLYVGDVEAAVPRPPRELRAFAKVTLSPGETKPVVFLLGERDFAFFDEASGHWVAEAGEFTIEVGSSSRDIRARAGFTLLP